MNNDAWPVLVLLASATLSLSVLSAAGCDDPVEGFAGPDGGAGGTGGTTSTGGMGPTTGGGGAGGLGDATLPLAVDDFFPGRAAFGSDDGAPLHTEDDDCPERAPDDPVGACHHVTYAGGTGTFTGAFWINGGSFEDVNPVAVEPGATEVTFYAWGASGGEVIEVGAGLGDADKDGAEDRRSITLTTTPTRYAVPLTNLAGYTEIFSAFVFAVAETPAEFYIDDIELVEGEPIGGPLSLPMVVDDNFPDRSAFGSNNGGPWHTEDTTTCPMRAGSEAGLCHTIVYGGEAGFTGAIWTIGSEFMNLESATIEAGADALQFYAWSASGAPQVEFGALDTGLGDAEQVRTVETLSTTPTQFTIPLPGNGAEITTKAAFVFAGASAANPSGFTIYVDDIQWVDLP